MAKKEGKAKQAHKKFKEFSQDKGIDRSALKDVLAESQQLQNEMSRAENRLIAAEPWKEKEKLEQDEPIPDPGPVLKESGDPLRDRIAAGLLKGNDQSNGAGADKPA